jgi:DNA-binding protein YbaB
VSSQDQVGSDILSQLGDVRGRGAAAEGLVRVEIDGTSAILDLTLDPKAMRLPSEDLAAAVREAFDAARGEVRGQLSAAEPPPTLDASTMLPVLTELEATATRRLEEITAIVDDLDRRLDRIPE